MIVEAIIGGITAIVCSSLYVANAIDKRSYEEDDDENADPKNRLYPFAATKRCPICGKEKYDSAYGTLNTGPREPYICKGSCKIRANHMHVKCISCKSEYPIEPYYKVEENKPS